MSRDEYRDEVGIMGFSAHHWAAPRVCDQINIIQKLGKVPCRARSDTRLYTCKIYELIVYVVSVFVDVKWDRVSILGSLVDMVSYVCE